MVGTSKISTRCQRNGHQIIPNKNKKQKTSVNHLDVWPAWPLTHGCLEVSKTSEWLMQRFHASSAYLALSRTYSGKRPRHPTLCFCSCPALPLCQFLLLKATRDNFRSLKCKTIEALSVSVKSSSSTLCDKQSGYVALYRNFKK